VRNPPGYWEVDQQEDPRARIRFLDGARQVPSVLKQKELTYDLLDLRPGQAVLAAACGTGDDLRAMAERVGLTGRAVGIDRSEVMVAEARSRSAGGNLPVEFQVCDIYALDFPDASFDATRAERIFEHLHDPPRALAELVRVTRPGGRIVAASPDMDSNLIDLPDRSVTRKIVQHNCDGFANGWAGRQLYGMFQAVGLADVTVVGVTHILTDYDAAVGPLGLADRARSAQAVGLISAQEATAWLEHLEQAGQEGRFFMSTTHFVIAGRKQ
jgi:SAM-dependent methyltransferase